MVAPAVSGPPGSGPRDGGGGGVVGWCWWWVGGGGGGSAGLQVARVLGRRAPPGKGPGGGPLVPSSGLQGTASGWAECPPPPHQKKEGGGVRAGGTPGGGGGGGVGWGWGGVGGGVGWGGVGWGGGGGGGVGRPKEAGGLFFVGGGGEFACLGEQGSAGWRRMSAWRSGSVWCCAAAGRGRGGAPSLIGTSIHHLTLGACNVRATPCAPGAAADDLGVQCPALADPI